MCLLPVHLQGLNGGANRSSVINPGLPGGTLMALKWRYVGYPPFHLALLAKGSFVCNIASIILQEVVGGGLHLLVFSVQLRDRGLLPARCEAMLSHAGDTLLVMYASPSGFSLTAVLDSAFPSLNSVANRRKPYESRYPSHHHRDTLS